MNRSFAAFLLLPFLAVPIRSMPSPTPQQAASSSQDSSAAPKNDSAPATKKPKKVWTNDELPSAGSTAGISVVGNSSENAQPSRTNPSPSPAGSSPAMTRRVANYRQQLRQLHIQLDVTEKKISDIRNFNGGNSSASGGIKWHGRYDMTPLDEQLKTLEEKRKTIKAQISDVEDNARKNGVQPGDLR